MSGGNEIVHQQHRLRIIAALECNEEPLDFATLKSISETTDGNLGAHLRTLENAGYVQVTKEAIGRRTRTWVNLTSSGRRAFRDHVAFLEDVLRPSLSGGPSKEGNKS
jgi:DNA-binding MarR family transcriptional regulator